MTIESATWVGGRSLDSFTDHEFMTVPEAVRATPSLVRILADMVQSALDNDAALRDADDHEALTNGNIAASPDGV